MSDELRIGTLLRLPQMTAEMIAFLKSAGLETSQIARASDDWMNGAAGVERSEQSLRLLAEYGIDCVSLFMMMAPGTTGDGFVTEEWRTTRMLFAARQLLWAKKHGIKYITCHVGALSNIGEDDAYKRLVSDFQQLLRFAEENGQFFLFETGPESVAGLKKIFADINSPSLGINFDPANFLYYNQDDPAVLVEEMWQYIKVVHCKDAVRPAAGEPHGHETVLGQGGTNFVQLMHTLLGKGYRGPLIIERELPYGPEQQKDVAEAIQLLKEIRSKYI
ncbi:MAG: sugar phosphate isomerase/epimerase [Victivallales bacterium]|nr:sugar phosphate isomerase/epimerase [Victivallales bacterium]